MLKLLHRHILKEILLATGMAMGLFIFVLLMGNALRDVAELVAAGKLGVGIFFKLIGLLIPYVAAYALPLGMLTGTLIALGRLSSQQEIVAMKAAGISLYQIASPVFLISFIKEANCVIKRGLYLNPFTIGVVMAARYISNADSDALIDDCAATLKAGNSLIIFPEGTRTT